MAKYDRNGCMIEVVEKLKTGQYLIRKVFTGQADGWEDEDFYTGDELTIVDEFFHYAPTKKLDERFWILKKKVEDLQQEKKNLEQEIRETQKAGKAKLAKYKKYDQLKNLDMFIDGKITHYVLEYWSSFKIISFEDAVPDERWDKESLKLLTLFGSSKGNLSWNLSKYSSGGSDTTVIPCVSYKEALAIAQDIVNNMMKLDHQGGDLIRAAQKYNLKIDPAYVRKYEEKEKAKKAKRIKTCEDKLAELKNEKESQKI